MQFAVIGAGNIGCLYGGNLARIGEQVTLIDIWEEHISQIRAHGLQMDGLHGTFTVSLGATTDPASAPKADVALICVNNPRLKRGGLSLPLLILNRIRRETYGRLTTARLPKQPRVSDVSDIWP